LPSWVHKTDSERIQNCEYLFPLENVVATEKIDGSSATYSLHQEEGFHVCSRNLSLYRTDGNTFWDMADRLDIEKVLHGYLKDSNALTVTVQGELFGEGIQSNRLGVKGHRFAAFNFEVDGRDFMYAPETSVSIGQRATRFGTWPTG
jgi:RNA ligase (TIGR02306 family)